MSSFVEIRPRGKEEARTNSETLRAALLCSQKPNLDFTIPRPVTWLASVGASHKVPCRRREIASEIFSRDPDSAQVFGPGSAKSRLKYK